MSGPALMVVTTIAFVILDAIVKWLSGTYGVMQIVAMRTAVSLVAIVAIAAWRGPRALRTAAPGAHALRGGLLLVSSVTFFHAFGILPLADAYTIFYMVPLAMTLLAALLLGERVPARAALAIALGLAGVAIVVGPQLGGGAALAYAACVVGTLCYGLVGVMTRPMSRRETPEALIFYPCVVIVAASLPFALLDWRQPALADLLLIGATGLLWPLAHGAFAAALKRAPVARLAPFEYSSIVWVVLVDLLVFGLAPEPATLVGSAVIIVACLLLVERAGRRAA
jgi:drug/metabolite transporter (DMT)-like permease